MNIVKNKEPIMLIGMDTMVVLADNKAWHFAHVGLDLHNRGGIVQFVRDRDVGKLQLNTLLLFCWPTTNETSLPPMITSNKHLALHAVEAAAPLVTEAAALAAKLHGWGQRV